MCGSAECIGATATPAGIGQDLDRQRIQSVGTQGRLNKRETFIREPMPIAHLYILEGRDAERKERLIAEVSEAIHRAIDAPLDSIRVLITEMPKEHFGIAGQSARKRGR